MRSSSNSLIKADQTVDTNSTVLDYKPRDFTLGTPEAALDYLVRKKSGSDFVLSDVLRQTTGIDGIEKETEEQKIEQKVLHKITEIQSQAYEEGYKLGREEGFAAALEKKTKEIERGLFDLGEVLNQVQSLKPDLIANNESHIVHLIYQVAQKIAFDHIEQKPEIVLDVIQKAIQSSQADEDITVLVSPDQLGFIEKYKELKSEKFEFLKNVKLQASEKVHSGGCIVQTNYGEIDARVEERIKTIWQELSVVIPSVQDKASGE
ncbi:MAG: FliH/SctL family protein [Pseudobdellovibrio sp.]